jgi:RimJ/RimL family protein N-acetyltransferase
MIRPARPAEEPVLRHLEHSTWSSSHTPAPLPSPDRPFALDGVLVAELAEGLAGYSRLVPVLPFPSSAHVLTIQGLTVAPAHQRRGIATVLLQATIAQAKTLGARRITLRVLSHNTAGLRLYAAAGFETEGVLRDLFHLDGRYVDEVLMTLPLD